MTIDMTSNMLGAVPENNIQIYAIIFVLETSLREYIIEKLSAHHGSKWYKQALPGGSIINAYRSAQRYEKATPWVRTIPHHPIYYLDFPDLATIIERNDNWNSAFKDSFQRKDITISALRGIEPIRNKIAHNRKATKKDLEIALGAYNILAGAIGGDYMLELSSRCTVADELLTTLKSLKDKAEQAVTNVAKYLPIGSLTLWREVKNSWWLDEEYLGHSVAPLYSLFDSLEQYESLPRQRGTGHIIEQWVQVENVEEKYQQLERCIDILVEEQSNG